MKTLPLLGVLPVVALLALMGAGPATQPVKWEYAYLRIGSAGYVVVMPERTIRGESAVDLLEKMGQKDATEDELAIWQALGRDGWEMCLHLNRGNGTMFYFKRPSTNR